MQDASSTEPARVEDFATLVEWLDHFAARARSRIDIVSPDLEPTLYDREPFVAALERLALDRRNARIRVLVGDARAAVRGSHRLVPLARRLPSFFELRRLRPAHADHSRGLLIVDARHVVDRPQAGRPEGAVIDGSPGRAKPFVEAFEALYAESDPHTEFRGLQL